MCLSVSLARRWYGFIVGCTRRDLWALVVCRVAPPRRCSGAATFAVDVVAFGAVGQPGAVGMEGGVVGGHALSVAMAGDR